jgi:hypothetical protein
MPQGEKNFSFVEESANNQTPERTLMIMVYELGKVIENYLKSQIYGVPQAYLGDLKLEASDLLSMYRMFIEQMDWPLEELMQIGETRYLERMADIRKHALQELLIKRGEE